MKTKNRFIIISLLVLTLLLSAVLLGCNGDGATDDPKTWKVTFNYNYTGAPASAVVDVEDDKKVTEPTAPTRSGYEFKGWFTDAGCAANTAFVFTTAIKADTTLYAGWELLSSSTKWEVTFNYNYTDAPSATKVEVVDGETVTRPSPAPTRDGYDFKGWYTDPGCATSTAFAFTTAIKADRTLYAGWGAKVVFVPDPENTRLNFASVVTAYAGTWKVSKVYADGKTADAVANSITLAITLEHDPWELVDGSNYVHNNVYNLDSVMTFGLPAINAALAAEDITQYTGSSLWDKFTMGQVVEEDGWYKQPGPAVMDFGNDMRDNGLFLDLVAGVSSDIDTENKELVIGMNANGQLLLGYSEKAIEYPDVQANWSYCLIFDKAE